MKYDAAVIGAGPVGSIAAEKGVKSLEVALIGGGVRRVQCAGLVSKSGLERLGINDNSFVLNRIRGARFYSPSGALFEVDGGRTMAYAVDRILFDEHLLEQALDAGVRYIEDRVVDANNAVKLNSGREIHAERIVLATGTDYTLHGKLNLDKPREFLIGMQYELGVEADDDFVELYFTIPDFFAWIIPLGDRARVGLCTKSNPRPHMEAFLKRLRREGRVKSDRILTENYGIIPVYNPSLRTQYDGVVMVGDAAGQVKASTGGGIVLGGVSAGFAFDLDYERVWRRVVGRELLMHLYIHRFLSGLSPRNIDRLFGMLNMVRGNFERQGDMDSAFKVFECMLRNPVFMLKFLANTPLFLADMI
jgi:digeranylgeranylglycerophospholipid reductase